MADIDVTEPEDTDLVSQFPANERASRAAVLDNLNGASTWGGTSGGSAQAQTLTVAMTGWDLDDGAVVMFIAGFTNTGADPEITVNATSARTVKDLDGNDLVPGDIVANRLHWIANDGTNFRLLNPALSGAISQALYDAILPVGFVQLKDNTTAPTNPTGITATWTRISTDAYLRGTSTTPSSGGSLTTDPDGGGTFESGSSGSQGGHGGGAGTNAPPNHTHDTTIPDHTHTYEPTFRSVSVWERTA